MYSYKCLLHTFLKFRSMCFNNNFFCAMKKSVMLWRVWLFEGAVGSINLIDNLMEDGNAGESR